MHGTVAGGRPVSTSRRGVHTFKVTAVSKDGQKATATVTYKVALPDNRFTIRHVHTTTKGRVSFKLELPGPGVANVLETAWLGNLARAAVLLQPALRRFVFARKHLPVFKAGQMAVTVLPNQQGRRLVAHHRYAILIRLWVSYTPTEGTQRDIGLYGVRITRPRPPQRGKG